MSSHPNTDNCGPCQKLYHKSIVGDDNNDATVSFSIVGIVSSVLLLVSMLMTIWRLSKGYKQSYDRDRLHLQHVLSGGSRTHTLAAYSPKQPPLVLPAYYSFAQFMCLLFFLQALAWLLPADTYGVHEVQSVIFVICAFSDMVLAIQMSRHPRASMVVSIVVALVLTSGLYTYIQVLNTSSNCVYCGIHFPKPGVEYADFALGAGFALIALLAKMHWRIGPFAPRAPLALWCLNLSISYFLGAVGVLLLHDDIGNDPGYCLMDVGLIYYTVTYAPLFYHCIVKDSKICRNSRMRDALAQSALSPLLEPEIDGEEGSGLPNELQALMNTMSVKMIPSSEIVYRKRIGSGGYGTVYVASWKGLAVAVKELFSLNQLAVSENERDSMKELCTEVCVLSQLRHPHCCLLWGVSIGKEHCGIVMEYLENGSVYDIQQVQKQQLTLGHLLCIMQHTVSGMEYLHSMNPPILHRDLKTKNLLVNKHWVTKVSDFGLATVKAKAGGAITGVGTPAWSAPEVLRDQLFAEPADVYSFAICVWEMIAVDEPFRGMQPIGIAHDVVYKEMRPVIPGNCPKIFKQLMEKCWSQEPSERQTFHELDLLLRSTTTKDLLQM